jgi:undecaprenyl-diphosphatase
MDGLDLYELLKAALFGLVEGITEWLPISSTGHMLLLDNFVKLNVSQDFWDMFLVVIQLGAILAVCVLFFGQLNPFSPRKDASQRRSTWSLWGKVVVSCIPAAAVGIPLDDWMEEHLGSPFVVAAALIVYGVAFIVIERSRERKAIRVAQQRQSGRHFAASGETATVSELADADARVQSIDELGWWTAIGIGIFQVLSIVPGTSRSGSTIIGGLLLGCSRTVAAEFTFFLAIPVMFGASALRLVKFFLKGNAFVAQELAILGVGCAVAFVVSMLSIRFLMGFVKRHDFQPFGWYRIVLGIVVIVYFGLAQLGIIAL